jgi:hypothetical protein
MNVYVGTIDTKPLTEPISYTQDQKQEIQKRITEKYAMQTMDGLLDLMADHPDKTSESYLACKELVNKIEQEYVAIIS